MLADHFDVSEPELLPRFNIAPTQKVAAVRAKEYGRELVFLRWGLIPSWAKEKSIGAKLINARAETVAEKPAFRSAFKHRRCLIATDGLFEWKKEDGKKQPYYITLRDGSPFAFAGLWEEWKGEDPGEPIQTCTILTTEANELMRPLHERMPVIIDPKDYTAWLDSTPGSSQTLLSLLRPFPSEAMRAYPVNSTVNNPRNQGPSCIKSAE